jgi:hypothetical protein
MDDLELFFQQFENWVLMDIRIIMKLDDGLGNRFPADRTSFKQRRPLVAAVILMCCAIDCLARFRYGKVNGDVSESFRNFVRSYLDSATTFTGKSYDDAIIYNGLRNAIVHGYSLQADLGLVHQSDHDHLRIVDNHTIIDVFSLYFDLETAYNKYKNELKNGSYLVEFDKRWKIYPLIQFRPGENIKGTA